MSRDVARNKKARRDYSISEVLEAGIQLRGTEVKSIREGKVNISDAFVRIERKEAFLYGCDIQALLIFSSNHALNSQLNAMRFPDQSFLNGKLIRHSIPMRGSG